MRRRGDLCHRAWDYLCSAYQILLLPRCEDTIGFLARRRQRPWAKGCQSPGRSAALRQGIATPLLSELEFVYYASVRRRYTISHEYGSEDDYLNARRGFEPIAALTHSGWSPEALLKVAEDWLFTNLPASRGRRFGRDEAGRHRPSPPRTSRPAR